MNLKRTASILAFLFAIGMGAPASFASDKSEVVDAVHRYLDNLDPDHPERLQTAFSMCDSEVSILDEFPPHEWHGPTACTVWWKGLLAYDDQNGITDGDATLGTPQTVDVSGDHAYFVAPMTYKYKQHNRSRKPQLSLWR
jgi:hypothetical protein